MSREEITKMFSAEVLKRLIDVRKILLVRKVAKELTNQFKQEVRLCIAQFWRCSGRATALQGE